MRGKPGVSTYLPTYHSRCVAVSDAVVGSVLGQDNVTVAEDGNGFGNRGLKR